MELFAEWLPSDPVASPSKNFQGTPMRTTVRIVTYRLFAVYQNYDIFDVNTVNKPLHNKKQCKT